MRLPPLPAMTWMQTYSKQQVKELMREYGQKCYEQGKADVVERLKAAGHWAAVDNYRETADQIAARI